MIPNEIKTNLKGLSRAEKFDIIQFLLTEFAGEEKEEISPFFKSGDPHGFWSQYDTFETAQKLQTLLET